MINVSSAEVPDAKVLKMIKRSEVTLELQKQIDYQSWSDAREETVTILVALYAICYLSDGTSIGIKFSIDC